MPGDLAETLDRSRVRLGPIGAPFLFFRSIGSTNDVAASLGIEGATVLAEHQTAGRGRRGHGWFSPRRSGLYVSVVLTPARAAADPVRATMMTTLAAGVAIAEAIDAVTGLSVVLKWPNDGYVSGRKVAGILAEAIDDYVVVGYGINVAATAYPPELAGRATSLETELANHVDRHQLFVETLASIARRYDDLMHGRFDAILDAWRARAPGAIGARVSWTDRSGVRHGVTAGIDAQGALLVRHADGLQRIVSGQLTWL